MDEAVAADPDRYEAIITTNEKDHAASGYWGVPTFVFEKEPFFGQDRIDLLIWRMRARARPAATDGDAGQRSGRMTELRRASAWFQLWG